MWGISYWVFPAISGLCWFGMLLGLLIHWYTTGQPQYSSMNEGQSLAFISDIGASELKPLFIAGSCVTTLFLNLSLLSERWLRHQGRLAKNLTVTEKVLSILSISFAFIGTAGLILLTIFDTMNYPGVHIAFLMVFMVGYIGSAIFCCWEYQRLGVHFREYRVLRTSFWMKLSFIIVELILAIAFVATRGIASNAAAILEWILAFIFTFYIFSFIPDLIPVVRNKQMNQTAGSGGGDIEIQESKRQEADTADDRR